MDDIRYKVAVVGGGSWATAIVKMLCENLPKVGWYVRTEQVVEHILHDHHNLN
jgi:glycerol-3-phosphate dehydrogenase (NAD(P)+)